MKKKKFMFPVVIWPSAMCEDGNYLWIVHGKIVTLFRYDTLKKNIDKMVTLEDEPTIREASMCAVIKMRNKVYTIPAWGNHIHCYDIDSNKECILQIKNEDLYRDKCIFRNAFIYNEKIYCIPATYKYLLEISYDGQIKYVNDIQMQLNNEEIVINATIYYDKKIFAVIANSNMLLIYDIENNKKEFKRIGIDDYKLSTIAIANEKLYATVFLEDYRKKFLLEVDIKTFKVLNEWNLEENVCLLTHGNNLIIDGVDNGKLIWGFNKNNKTGTINEEGKTINKLLEFNYHHGVVTESFFFSRHSYRLYKVESGKIDLNNYDEIETAVDECFLYKREIKTYEDNLFNLERYIHKLIC